MRSTASLLLALLWLPGTGAAQDADPELAALSIGIAPFEAVAPPGRAVPDLAPALAAEILAKGAGRTVAPATLASERVAEPSDRHVRGLAEQHQLNALVVGRAEEDYAVAARLLGAGHGRIIFRHLLPGFTSHVIVSLTLTVPRMILGETSLSFLGLGLRPPVVSWGVLLAEAQNVETVLLHPWLLIPGIFVIVTVLTFNFLGDGLRDAADPYK